MSNGGTVEVIVSDTEIIEIPIGGTINVGSSVTSVFGRQGTVVAESGDYELNEITGLVDNGAGILFLADDGTYKNPDIQENPVFESIDILGVNNVVLLRIESDDAQAVNVVEIDTNGGSGGDLFRISSTGEITIANAFTLPIADGNAGEVLGTDGAGNIDWVVGGLWTDAGTVTHLTSVTDDLAVGGTDNTSPFFVTAATGQLTLAGTGDISGLAFGDGDTVIYEAADDDLRIDIGTSSAVVRMTSGYMRMASGARIQNEAASGSNPVFVDHGNENTGIGFAGTDQLSLIAGANEVVRVADATQAVKINVVNPTDIGQIIELAAVPTANAFEINTNGGSGGDLFVVVADGNVGINDDPTDAQLSIVNDDAAHKGIYLQGADGQADDFMLIENDAGDPLFKMGSNERVGIDTSTLSYALNIGGDRQLGFIGGNAVINSTAWLSYTAQTHVFNTGDLRVNGDVAGAAVNIKSKSSGEPVLAIQGFTGQTADLFIAREEGGAEVFEIQDDGRVRIASDTASAILELDNNNVGGNMWQILSEHSTNGNFEIRFGSDRIRLQPDGYLGIGADHSPSSMVDIKANLATDVGQIIELAAVPTANAFEINTNGGSGGDIFKITAGGRVETTLDIEVQTGKAILGNSSASNIGMCGGNTFSSASGAFFEAAGNSHGSRAGDISIYAGNVAGGQVLMYTSNVERLGIADTGEVTFNNAFTFPTVDGTIGQHLETDGAGNVTWEDAGGASLWTDGGTVTHLTSVTDDLAIGGTDDTAQFFFDAGTGDFRINSISGGSGAIEWYESATDFFRLDKINGDDLQFNIDTGSGPAPLLTFNKFKRLGFPNTVSGYTAAFQAESGSSTTMQITKNLGEGDILELKVEGATGSPERFLVMNYLGAEKHVFDDDHNNFRVGFNNDDPQAQLHVAANSATDVGQIIELAGSPTANAFEINSLGGSGGDLFQVTAGGLVGIGDNPVTVYSLEVSTTTGANSLSLSRVLAAVTDDSLLGELIFAGTDGNQSSTRRGAKIAAYGAGPWQSSDTPGTLRFYTTPALVNDPVERARIDEDGNIGIGETSPAAKLHVNGGGSSLPAISGDTSFIVADTTSAATTAGMSIISGNTGISRLNFGDTDDEDAAKLIMNHGNYFEIAYEGEVGYRAQAGIVYINPNGSNIGFRVEGDTDQNLIATSPTLDRVGISNSVPDGLFHISGKLNTEAQLIVDAAASQSEDIVQIRDDLEATLLSIDSGGSLVLENASPIKAKQAGGTAVDFIEMNTSDQMVFNPGSIDMDTIWNGNNQSSLFFINAGTDRVGIATASPGGQLHIKTKAAADVGLIVETDVSTPTANTFEVNSDGITGGDRFRLDATGNAFYGVQTGDPATPVNGVEIYSKDVNSSAELYSKNEAGTVQRITGVPTTRSYTFVARDASNGENFIGGFYHYSSSDHNLSDSNLTGTVGSGNSSYAAHAFIVAGAAGTTDGSDLVLTVSGTSITDAGVRTTSDTEVIVADATAAATDGYFETDKKWIGTVTFTLSSTGGTTFDFDFNYGLAKYDDFGNRDLTITDFEAVGLANANDSGVEIDLLFHTNTGWTYNATAFIAGGMAVASMTTDHSTESNLDAGEPFAYKRAGLSQAVDGSALEGWLIRVTTSINNSISYLNAHVGFICK